MIKTRLLLAVFVGTVVWLCPPARAKDKPTVDVSKRCQAE